MGCKLFAPSRRCCFRSEVINLFHLSTKCGCVRSDGVSKTSIKCCKSRTSRRIHSGIYGINARRASGPHLIGIAADLPPFHRVCKSRPRAVACVWRRVRARPGRVELPRCRTSPSPCRCKRNLSGAGANQRPPNLLVWYDSPSEHNFLASLLVPPSVSASPPSLPPGGSWVILFLLRLCRRLLTLALLDLAPRPAVCFAAC